MSSDDRPTTVEAEITPAMAEAGAVALLGNYSALELPCFDAYSRVACAIFAEMRKASRESPLRSENTWPHDLLPARSGR
jgi:hypothetical protein